MGIRDWGKLMQEKSANKSVLAVPINDNFKDWEALKLERYERSRR
ncbi:MAG: hypothetical protein ACFKPT_25365 [Gloeotrichia echinulata GP01]